MAEFDLCYMTFHQSAIGSIALSCTILELFDAEECHDLEGSLKVIENKTI